MLDVSVRAGILNLMREIQQSLGLTAVYISHDLALVRYVARRTLVMYLATIVEDGPTERVVSAPLHPYTRALVAAVPIPRVEQNRGPLPIRGNVPDARNPCCGDFVNAPLFHPPAAASTIAARSRSRAAARRCRRCARSRRGTARRVIWCRQSSGAATFASWQTRAACSTLPERAFSHALLPRTIQDRSPSCSACGRGRSQCGAGGASQLRNPARRAGFCLYEKFRPAAQATSSGPRSWPGQRAHILRRTGRPARRSRRSRR